MQLNEIRRELQFNLELSVLIETLKNIAGAQYQMMEKEKKARFERFLTMFMGFFRVVHMTDSQHPLVRSRSDVCAIMAITSDAGFMGGLNAGVIRGMHEKAEGLDPEKVHFIVVGEKGAALMGDSGRPFKFFQGITNETRYEQAIAVRDYLVGEVLANRIGRVIAVYPKALSFTRQSIEAAVLLPCADLLDRAEAIERSQGGAGWRGVVVESDLGRMAEHLASVWLSSKLYEMFEDSKLAEFAARAMHLEGSVQKLQELNKKLKYQFFRAAHENVDKGMRESYSAKKVRVKTQKG